MTGSPLDLLLPGLTTTAYADRAGQRVGVLGWAMGRTPAWSVLLRLDGVREPAGLLGPLSEGLIAGDVPVAATQLVRWSVPQPGDRPDTWDVCWVAARLDPVQATAAVAARGGGVTGAVQATAVAGLRLALRLRAAGYAVRPVEEDRLRPELAASLGAPDAVVIPAKHTWSVGPLRHVAFRVPGQADHALWAVRPGPPALSSCLAVQVTPARTGVKVRASLRLGVATDPDRVAVEDAVRRSLAGLDRRLTAMTGDQAQGVLATLPLGVY
ncbi:type VII secretion protein EccE [Hamadaea flava]|uniref:Type VII secretion protein EccE n=1 Tax=Hamadaea flava TaxID=1742688 RepID=A0ABV8LX65_9ACTN|nr:type VII secretion protein EccE [Hamadaea flava]MCP2321603.1 type VII secretion protein EccE [Hamadaea flava]